MSASHIAGNRNSTPEVSNVGLRPPASRSIAATNHALRASADMGAYPSPLTNRGIRPSSEVYFNNTKSGNPDEMERAAQQWIADIDQYEATLEEMAAATLDQDFKDELSAIEQWFRVLSEAERTAALYALLQQTTQVQIRFFIQVLQQMAKSHPMSDVLSPSNFGEKDPMSQKLSDAMSKLNVDNGARNSIAGRPPPSPGAGAKRNSQLDPSTIYSMFPDAAAAIAKQKAEFTQHTGMAPASNRNSLVDRNSLAVPNVSPEDVRKENTQPPASPWGPRHDSQGSAVRPKSASSQQQPPMGQFAQPPPSAGLRSPRPPGLVGDSNVQNTTVNAPLENPPNTAGMGILSPYAGSGNWASMVNTPMVPNFQQQTNHTDMIANATAMKLAALSTVNNRIQLDDVKKYRRARSSEGQGMSPGMGGFNGNVLMTNELGQVLSPQQAAVLQAQQLAAMQGRRSRPNSPGLAMQGGLPGVGFTSPQSHGFLSTYDGTGNMVGNGLAGMNMGQFGGLTVPSGHEGYISDHSDMNRGRSPRGRRGSSKPPEDPTDIQLLSDIPQWLRTLRLHKYTDNLKDLRWDQLVELKEEDLEARGVAAVGARRKMLKVFEDVQKKKSEGRYEPYLSR